MFSLYKDSCTLMHINTRTEKHGDDDVPAIDLKFQISLHNSKLNDFSPGMRESLYSGDEHHEDMVDEYHMPNLRHERLTVFSLNYELPAAKLVIYEDGTNDEQMSFTGCKVKKFKFQPKDGGSVITTFSVAISDPDPEYYSQLVQLLSCSVKLDLEQVTVQDEDAAGALTDAENDSEAQEQADQMQLDQVMSTMREG